jgi:Tfp pilus assembly protein PilN
MTAMARPPTNTANPNQPPSAAPRANRTSSGPGGLSPAAAAVAKQEPPRPEAHDDPPNMLALDFLPGEYRKRDVVRKTRLWQLVVVLLLGGVVASAAVLQYGLRCSVRRQLATVAGPHAQAQEEVQRLNQLQNELRLAEQRAELYLYLQHPWARTQVLRAVVRPIPPSMRLEELQIGCEAANSGAPGRQEKNSTLLNEEPTIPLDTAQQDLQQLRSACDSRLTVVRVSGTTRSAADMYQYLATVEQSPLIKDAKLLSLETTGDERHPQTSRFSARFEVVPGFGLPNGPRAPEKVAPDLAGALPRCRETKG